MLVDSRPMMGRAAKMRLYVVAGLSLMLLGWVYHSVQFLHAFGHSHAAETTREQPLIVRTTAAVRKIVDKANQKHDDVEDRATNGETQWREINVKPSVEDWPMKQDFYTAEYPSNETSTTIIFNLFKGTPKAFEMQLDMATRQKHVVPPEIWVMCFDSPMRVRYEAVVRTWKAKKDIKSKIVFTTSDFNHKFHGRFLLAYMAKTKYVLVIDDDKLIDETTVYDYIRLMKKKKGLWGNMGHIRAPTFAEYKSWPRNFTEFNTTKPPFVEYAEVDYLSGMWFLEQSWLEYFVKERPPSFETAEDMHLSHVMRKYLNLNSYGGAVALYVGKAPRKKHAATVGSALRLREYIFDHQLGRGNKVADVDQPIQTLVYAETVDDIEDFRRKVEACSPIKRFLRDVAADPGGVMATPWCDAGKTAVVFRGGKEQDVVGMIAAAERLCAATECEYWSIKPKIKHPIRYFNMREGYGQAETDIPWQTAASDVLMSFVGVLNNILPRYLFIPDVKHARWVESEPSEEPPKMNRLQIYHETIRLAINIHRSSPSNQKWSRRGRADLDNEAYPSTMRAFTWRPSTTDDENAMSLWTVLYSDPSKAEVTTSPQTEDMGGVDKYPYPKYTWSPAGGWWLETKNWRTKTGVALGVMALVALPLALHSSRTHVKYPSPERRKLSRGE
ncbi:hypothetical protein Poli38472_009236 [Pythium oligandrum]|uniref:Uncharacterized protein n=1 Tax=Pythium oligandrum TaxID=41045 RepID=A0A8K1FLA7_PYTOL|nr:hypothetical protein Poli38472_009236 [Pythium oligandrum]|eukprot:TMW65069.1 hypothetical protein Poli38472_009236 [Pythium oligandrum]